jgi:hypothetical protein
MNILKLYLFLILIGTLFLYCSSSTDPLGNNRYSYTAYDSTGHPVVTGWIKIEISDSNRVEGSWYLTKIRSSVKTTHATGDGKLEGVIENNGISLDLNPGWRDNNTVLVGKFEDNKITGKWAWISFIGITEEGTFVAN